MVESPIQSGGNCTENEKNLCWSKKEIHPRDDPEGVLLKGFWTLHMEYIVVAHLRSGVHLYHCPVYHKGDGDH